MQKVLSIFNQGDEHPDPSGVPFQEPSMLEIKRIEFLVRPELESKAGEVEMI